MSTVRLVLVDDHPVVREGLRLVLGLQPDFAVVGDAETTGEAIVVTERERPDVVIMDVALGMDDGIPTIETIVARHPTVRIVVLTMFQDPETTRQALLAGAAGIVVKGARSAELVDAIRAVLRGERYVHSSVAGPIVEDGLRWVREGSRLSPREREVASLLAGGRSPARIGEVLGISVHTVRRHLTSAAAKVGVRGTTGLSRYAREHGLARAMEPLRGVDTDAS